MSGSDRCTAPIRSVSEILNLDLRVRRDHVPYDVWERQGFLQTTEGNVVHYGYIEKFIESLGERFNIREIAFDRWGAVQMVQNLEGMGFTVVPFGQGFKDMSPPTKELMKTHFVKFNVDGLLRGDYQSRMNGYAIGRQNGWMSANDIRELENLDRIPTEEGGDLYLINGNMLPLKNAGAFANTPNDDGKEENPDEEVLELEEQDGDQRGDAGADSGENTVPERHDRRGKLQDYGAEIERMESMSALDAQLSKNCSMTMRSTWKAISSNSSARLSPMLKRTLFSTAPVSASPSVCLPKQAAVSLPVRFRRL